MTPRALKAHAKEHLTEQRRERGRFTARSVNHSGANTMRAALGRQDLADHPVVRFVFRKTLTNPVVDRVRALQADPRNVGPKQIAPAIRPRVGVAGIVEQTVNQPVALGCIFVSQKTPHLGRLRQHAQYINECPANELRVRAKIARQNAEFLKTTVRFFIDEIVHRQTSINSIPELAACRDSDSRQGDLAHVTHDNHPLPIQRTHSH